MAWDVRSPAWIAREPLCLASTSETRRALLESAGLVPDLEASGVDERAIEQARANEGLSPSDLALRLAEAKALAVSRRRPGYVIGADQTLDLAGKVLHKAGDVATARCQLAALSGREHALRSAVVIAKNGTVLDAFAESARLTMRSLDASAIERYLALIGEEVLGRVGIYQVEGLGVHLFERIAGDHSTILGLPLIPLLARLRARGCLAF
jgi:septum formation protein